MDDTQILQQILSEIQGMKSDINGMKSDITGMKSDISRNGVLLEAWTAKSSSF